MTDRSYDPSTPAGAIVERWMNEVGRFANDELTVVPGDEDDDLPWHVIAADCSEGVEVVTLANDWSVKLEAPTLEALAELMKRDLGEAP